VIWRFGREGAGAKRTHLPILSRAISCCDGRRQMPFSKNIKHEHIEAMRAAFHKVCDALLLNGDVDDPMTEVVVDKIVALEKAGEHDADRLTEHVLNDLMDDSLPPPSGKPRQDPSPQV
jgi:hypothetical protein